MEIKAGQWIMKEGMLLGRFSKPFRVTEVKGAWLIKKAARGQK